MFIPKRYGQSRLDKCPFCQRHATTLNSQKAPVCQAHREEKLENLRCACFSTLEVMSGKFGIFFSCMKCGNIGLKKALELNKITPKIKKEGFSQKTQQKEMTVRSDDPRYFD